MRSREVTRVVQRTTKRSLIVFGIGFVWFLFTPLIFIWGLPQFGFYLQWMKNYGTNTNDVYQFWTLVPEIILFVFGIFWAGGMVDTVLEHLS